MKYTPHRPRSGSATSDVCSSSRWPVLSPIAAKRSLTVGSGAGSMPTYSHPLPSAHASNRPVNAPAATPISHTRRGPYAVRTGSINGQKISRLPICAVGGCFSTRQVSARRSSRATGANSVPARTEFSGSSGTRTPFPVPCAPPGSRRGNNRTSRWNKNWDGTHRSLIPQRVCRHAAGFYYLSNRMRVIATCRMGLLKHRNIKPTLCFARKSFLATHLRAYSFRQPQSVASS